MIKTELLRIDDKTILVKTYSTDGFYMYHVGVDSHDCYPVSVDDIFEDIRKERESRK